MEGSFRIEKHGALAIKGGAVNVGFQPEEVLKPCKTRMKSYEKLLNVMVLGVPGSYLTFNPASAASSGG